MCVCLYIYIYIYINTHTVVNKSLSQKFIHKLTSTFALNDPFTSTQKPTTGLRPPTGQLNLTYLFSYLSVVFLSLPTQMQAQCLQTGHDHLLRNPYQFTTYIHLPFHPTLCDVCSWRSVVKNSKHQSLMTRYFHVWRSTIVVQFCIFIVRNKLKGKVAPVLN